MHLVKDYSPDPLSCGVGEKAASYVPGTEANKEKKANQYGQGYDSITGTGSGYTGTGSGYNNSSSTGTGYTGTGTGSGYNNSSTSTGHQHNTGTNSSTAGMTTGKH